MVLFFTIFRCVLLMRKVVPRGLTYYVTRGIEFRGRASTLLRLPRWAAAVKQFILLLSYLELFVVSETHALF
jgi:hypothetical protein